MEEKSRIQKISQNLEDYDLERTLVTENEAAEFLNLPTITTLRNIRKQKGIDYVAWTSPHPKARPRVYYRLSTLVKFKAKSEKLAEADAA
jgi:hypothetical protein